MAKSARTKKSSKPAVKIAERRLAPARKSAMKPMRDRRSGTTGTDPPPDGT